MTFQIHPAGAPPAAQPPPQGPFRWVPIRSLSERHRPRILAHLLTLDERDRYLRFGHAAGDSQVARYVDQIDFDTDEVFGIFNRRLEVVAMAHLAYLGGTTQAAEFGVSVSPGGRGRGWGARLFDRAVLHARNRRVTTLHIHALTENAAMLHIARAAGAVVDVAGPDATARLTLPPENIASHVEALVAHQAAELDYGLKVQARRVDGWLGLLHARPTPPETHAPAPGAVPAGREGEAGPPV